VGRHALLPCQECHAETRELRFVRTTVSCLGCHVADVVRTSTSGVDHVRLGLGETCQNCHDGWRWAPARFPQHDACFQISAGPHARIACRSCHTTIPQVAPGSCVRASTSCTGCHTHSCATTDAQHTSVPGYVCNDASCYSCHRLTGQP
jgi:hypothetical protein